MTRPSGSCIPSPPWPTRTTRPASPTTLMSRWGAIGHDGAQAVNAAQVTLKNTGQRYTFAIGQFTNIDASAVVSHGDPPSGAHSDIVHPELGWAMLSAAGLV